MPRGCSRAFSFRSIRMYRSVGLGLAAVVAMGCSNDKSPAPATNSASNSAPSASGAASMAGRATLPTAGGTLTGTVREQIPVGPYVYLRLDTERGEEWAAVNDPSADSTTVQVGQAVTVYNVMVMEQFASQTLKRTFARIYFGSTNPNAGAGTSGATGAAGNAPATGAAMPGVGASGESPGTPAAVDAHVGTVARAAGRGAHTVGELFAQQQTLAGTSVSVRGVVVKYNPGVMGMNWIHLQDGSGNATKGTHDVTAISNDVTAVGDTVTVTGTVRLNKDFGAGYVYPLVIDGAKVVRQ